MAETFFYLTTTGRKTGRPHQIEIWYVDHEGCYFICAGGRDNADFVKNVRLNATVSYYLAQGKDAIPEQIFQGRARIVPDDEALAEVVKPLFDEKYKWSSGLLVQICPE